MLTLRGLTYVICYPSLAAFNICSWCLIFISLITVSWHVSLWVYHIWDSLRFLDLDDYFFSDIKEVFNDSPPVFSQTLSSSSGKPIIQILEW